MTKPDHSLDRLEAAIRLLIRARRYMEVAAIAFALSAGLALLWPCWCYGQLLGGSSSAVRKVGDCQASSCFATDSAIGTSRSFRLNGSGGGAGTLQCVGTTLVNPTWSLPTGSGTIAVSTTDSTGVALNTTTGNIALTTVPLANGGTGATTKTPAFNALSPATTKGDVIVSTGSSNVAQAIGANNTVLTADSAVTNGLKWTTPVSGFGGDGSDGACSWNGSTWTPAGCFFNCPNNVSCTVLADQAIPFGVAESTGAPNVIANTKKRVAMRQFTSLSMSGTAVTVSFVATIKRIAILVSGDATLSTGTVSAWGNGEAGGAGGSDGGTATACLGGGGGSTPVFGGGLAGSTVGGAGGNAAASEVGLFRYPWTAPWMISGAGGGGGCRGRSTAGTAGSDNTQSLWGSMNIAAAGGGGGGCTANSGNGTPGAGGTGGGVLYFEVGGVATVASAVTLNASGVQGVTATGTKASGGGGGGGGAVIFLHRSGTVNSSGFLANGGAGGAAAGTGCGAGGNGGTGLVIVKQIF